MHNATQMVNVLFEKTSRKKRTTFGRGDHWSSAKNNIVRANQNGRIWKKAPTLLICANLLCKFFAKLSAKESGAKLSVKESGAKLSTKESGKKKAGGECYSFPRKMPQKRYIHISNSEKLYDV